MKSMKKTILLLLIIVSFSSLKAQESTVSASSSGGLYIGVKAGYGIVNFKAITNADVKFAKTSYDNVSYGILAGYKLNSLLSVQLEGNYAQYGAHNIVPTYIYSAQSPVLANIGSNSIIDHVDMDLFNIDVPLTVKLSLGEGGFTPYIYGGVNLGINVSAKASIIRQVTFNDVISYRTSTDNITPRIIQNEFAPVAGCGVMLNIFKLTFCGDVRYKYGFTNLSNVDNHLGFTNSAIYVSAGLILNL
jgi:hypothetical protein